MTIIKVNEKTKLDKNEFKNLDELLFYLIEKKEIGSLIPLKKEEITAERLEKFKIALQTPKSNMLNI